MRTLTAALIASLAGPVWGQSIAWDQKDPVAQLRQAAQTIETTAPPIAAAPKGEKPKKPKFKYDDGRMRMMLQRLLNGATPMGTRPYPQFKMVDRSYEAGADMSDSFNRGGFQGGFQDRDAALTPVAALFRTQNYPLPRPNLVVLTLTQSGGPGADAEAALGRGTVVGFALDGLRAIYVVNFGKPDQKALFEDYKDELNGDIADEEMVTFGLAPFEARSALRYAVEEEYKAIRQAAKEAATPWYAKPDVSKQKLGEQGLQALRARYDFSRLVDLDGDGTDELVQYRAEPEKNRLENAQPDKKWNYLYVGYRLGRDEKASLLEVEHRYLRYAGRDFLGGMWDEPFIEDYQGKVALVKDASSCGIQAKAVIVVDGGDKAYGVVLRNIRPEPPYPAMYGQRRELTPEERTCLLGHDLQTLSKDVVATAE